MILQAGDSSDRGPKLEPAGAGRLRYRDPRFTAIIAADGSVEFHDVRIRADTNILGIDPHSGALKPPKPHARDAFEERALYPQGPPTAAMFVSVGGNVGGLIGALVQRIRRKAKPHSHEKIHAAAKAQFLAETAPLRQRMAHTALGEHLAAQQHALIARALEIWHDQSVPIADRRRQLFELWDECADPHPDPQSPAEVLRSDAARTARTRLETLVRRLAPAGSPQQFTATELHHFNANRHSSDAFNPYGQAIRGSL